MFKSFADSHSPEFYHRMASKLKKAGKSRFEMYHALREAGASDIRIKILADTYFKGAK